MKVEPMIFGGTNGVWSLKGIFVRLHRIWAFSEEIRGLVW